MNARRGTARRLRIAPAAGVAALCAALAACGGGSPDPLAPYRSQVLAWQPCDATILGAQQQALKDFGVTMAELGSRVTCATMRAPIDYANPARGELRVALMRVAALDPKQRLGAILFNPGGPGGDGLFLAPIFAAIWTRADGPNPAAPLYRQMSRSYDVVGFSPRGTGASTRVYCGSNELLKPIANDTADRSQANLDAMLYNARITAEACAKNPLTPFVNTDATARDMDLLRHLLGDEKLNYYGISYGTWLGTWYAGLFPERVGRMLLTGVVDQTQGIEESFLNIPMGYQRVFDELIVPYAAGHADIFSARAGAPRFGAIFGSITDSNLRGAVSDVVSPKLRQSSSATSAVLGMVAADAVRELLAVRPALDQSQLLARLASTPLASIVEVQGELTLDDVAHDLARQIVAGYFARLSPAPRSVDVAGEDAMGFAVVSNDYPMRLDVTGWIAATNRNAASYPLAGGMFTEWPGLYWGGPTVTRPSFERMRQAGDIVMMQTEYDGVTPLEGAEKSFAALPNASVVLIRGEYSHGTFVPYGRPCSDEPVARYFLYGTKPAPRTDCPGLPLYWDEKRPAGVVAKSAMPGRDSMFSDPQGAAVLYRQLEGIVSRASASRR